jgi:hypothetical protein
MSLVPYAPAMKKKTNKHEPCSYPIYCIPASPLFTYETEGNAQQLSSRNDWTKATDVQKHLDTRAGNPG